MDQTGRAVTHAVDQTVKAAVIATQQAGRAIEKAGQDVGHGAEEVGKFVEKHPWETVIAVALIAGGGYLIVYEGFTLTVTVQGVQVVAITGATSGVVVGSAAAADGGLIIDATMKSPVGSETTVIETPHQNQHFKPENLRDPRISRPPILPNRKKSMEHYRNNLSCLRHGYPRNLPMLKGWALHCG